MLQLKVDEEGEEYKRAGGHGVINSEERASTLFSVLTYVDRSNQITYNTAEVSRTRTLKFNVHGNTQSTQFSTGVSTGRALLLNNNTGAVRPMISIHPKRLVRTKNEFANKNERELDRERPGTTRNTELSIQHPTPRALLRNCARTGVTLLLFYGRVLV